MSARAGVRRPHLADEELLRVVDRQLDLERSRRARAHLGGCAECAARLEALRARSAVVAEAVAALPHRASDPARRALALASIERAAARWRTSTPAHGTAPMLLRIAATVVLLLAFGLGTGTGRNWVGERVEALAGPEPGRFGSAVLRIFGRSPARPTLQAVDAAPRPAGSGGASDAAAPRRLAPRKPAPAGPPPLRFAPAGREVVLEFRSVQQAGYATMTLRNLPDATARISANADGEKLIATPEGLEVRNAPDSRADYSIVVPTRFRVVRIRIAKRQEMLIRVTPGKREWLWTINLAGTALR